MLRRATRLSKKKRLLKPQGQSRCFRVQVPSTPQLPHGIQYNTLQCQLHFGPDMFSFSALNVPDVPLALGLLLRSALELGSGIALQATARRRSKTWRLRWTYRARPSKFQLRSNCYGYAPCSRRYGPPTPVTIPYVLPRNLFV